MCRADLPWFRGTSGQEHSFTWKLAISQAFTWNFPIWASLVPRFLKGILLSSFFSCPITPPSSASSSGRGSFLNAKKGSFQKRNADLYRTRFSSHGCGGCAVFLFFPMDVLVVRLVLFCFVFVLFCFWWLCWLWMVMVVFGTRLIRRPCKGCRICRVPKIESWKGCRISKSGPAEM